MTNVELWLIGKGMKPEDFEKRTLDVMEDYAKDKAQEEGDSAKDKAQEEHTLLILEKVLDEVEYVLCDINKSLNLDIDLQEVREEIIDRFYKEYEE